VNDHLGSEAAKIKKSYRRILGDHGFTLVDVHADSGNNTYYLAKKAEPTS
jgi:hypothetical protein